MPSTRSLAARRFHERRSSSPRIGLLMGGSMTFILAERRQWPQAAQPFPDKCRWLLARSAMTHAYGRAIRSLALDYGCLWTTPSFITKTTSRIALMSVRGSPETAMMSASLSGSMVPRRSSMRSSLADTNVAD